MYTVAYSNGTLFIVKGASNKYANQTLRRQTCQHASNVAATVWKYTRHAFILSTEFKFVVIPTTKKRGHTVEQPTVTLQMKTHHLLINKIKCFHVTHVEIKKKIMEIENVNTHISNGNPECIQFADTFDIVINEITSFQCYIIL